MSKIPINGTYGGNYRPLSDREAEVLRLLARGYGNKQIAAELSISENTVKSHVANIFLKLQVNHRNQAVTKAMALGIINS